MNLQSHFWTLAPFLRYNLAPPAVPASKEWETRLDDQAMGELKLTGRLSQTRTSDTLVLVVHGLGGSAESYYALRAAKAIDDVGLDSLRLNLRGADRRGDDYYHAGLTADLEATLESRALAHYSRILILAYSLGGNMMLRYLAGDPDPRIQAAAAVCSPIDLARGAHGLDATPRALYRHHVLRGLKEIYAEVAARKQVPIPLSKAQRIDTIRRWDDEVIAPRHGFAGAADYWERTSACFVLDKVRVPVLFLAEERDPMVLIEDVRPWIDRAPTLRRVITDQGGHVGFPQKVDLGMGTRGTVENQIIQWMLAPT